MKKLFYILICLMISSSVFGQKPDQIIITVIEQTDWTFNKKDELFLQTNVKKNQIIYTLDNSIQAYTTSQFLIESYYNIWDGDTIVKEKLKTKHKRWSNKIDSLKSIELIISINTDVDTLEKDMSVLHTSHHYLTIYLDVISENDTLNYYKTKPFKFLTPWFSEQSGSILNPEIDEQLFLMLPEKFIGRDKLKLVLTKPKLH